ncbi:MAG: 4-alpha-glucanotransferase [Candidatus Promineifilaceae bacterium]
MRFPRRAGVLLHPTSFPGRYGVGDLGPGAYAFLDFLAGAGQSLWQVLPLGPTGYADSPYQAFSSFAGNPLLINPDRLTAEGYLPAAAVKETLTFAAGRVDFGWVIGYKEALLRRAWDQFRAKGRPAQRRALEEFNAAEAAWLDDFALFMALKGRFKETAGGVWNSWPAAIGRRHKRALNKWRAELAAEVGYYQFQQFLFFEQWRPLRAYAHAKGIQIIGDVPIFVAFDSADVWANRELFYLDRGGSPKVVAGVPPDYFSQTGQRWGNPLYRWQAMARDDYAWWAARLAAAFRLVDIIRIDHFRGFEAYWEIPADQPTAVVGRWLKGPGAAFFEAMQRRLGELPIIAEDLGVITPEVTALRERFNLPGMKILQFAFGGERNSDFLPHNFGRNCVVYTGTHDNETAVGWYLNADRSEQDHVRRYLARDGSDIAWDLVRLALASTADTAIVPLQDLMSLGNEARMNFPGKSGGWWSWRYTRQMLTPFIALRLAEMTELYGRAQKEPGSSDALPDSSAGLVPPP